MKRYIKSSTKKYVKATSDYYQILDWKIRDFFQQYLDSLKDDEDFEEYSHDYIADFIAQHMENYLDYDEWKDLAFDWLQMNYK